MRFIVIRSTTLLILLNSGIQARRSFSVLEEREVQTDTLIRLNSWTTTSGLHHREIMSCLALYLVEKTSHLQYNRFHSPANTSVVKLISLNRFIHKIWTSKRYIAIMEEISREGELVIRAPKLHTAHLPPRARSPTKLVCINNDTNCRTIIVYIMLS